MCFSLELTESAEQDLADIYDYVCQHDCVESADYLLDQLLATANTLTEQPTRGSYPQELLQLGIKDYHQIFFKPYRIIYRQFEKRLIIYLIVDGRRDLRSLLKRRLFNK